MEILPALRSTRFKVWIKKTHTRGAKLDSERRKKEWLR